MNRFVRTRRVTSSPRINIAWRHHRYSTNARDGAWLESLDHGFRTVRMYSCRRD